jgi:hypothetical protein
VLLEVYELPDGRRPQSSEGVGVNPGEVPPILGVEFKELKDGLEPRLTGGPLSTGGAKLLYLSGLGDLSGLEDDLPPSDGAGSTLVFRGMTLFRIPSPVNVSPLSGSLIGW